MSDTSSCNVCENTVVCVRGITLVAGTYYGQWMSGMRHGVGVRQSASFGSATPMRFNEQLNGKRGNKQYNSLPVLNEASSSNDTASLQVNMAVGSRGRAGFTLTADRGRMSASVREPARTRSSSLRRSLAKGFRSISLRQQKPDLESDSASRVSFLRRPNRDVLKPKLHQWRRQGGSSKAFMSCQNYNK